MVLNKFRYISEKYIDKPVDWLIRHKVSPNTLTLIGFCISIIAAIGYAFPDIFIYRWYLAWFPCLLFFLSGYFDVLDGGVARKGGLESKFGAFLDSTLDRLSDSIIVLGLMHGRMFWRWDKGINDLLGFLILISTLMISYTRSRAENEGIVMKGVGWMERAERVFIIMGAYIIESCFKNDELINFGIYTPSNPYTYWFFPIFSIVYLVLLVITVIQRILHAYKWTTGKISKKYLEKYQLTGHYSNYLKELEAKRSIKDNDK
ncbi:MAG: CDP-alcohol phosphatidyltransferase family protein [Promethearchaeota archaeon]